VSAAELSAKESACSRREGGVPNCRYEVIPTGQPVNALR
jgi:hypothetical protein